MKNIKKNKEIAINLDIKRVKVKGKNVEIIEGPAFFYDLLGSFGGKKNRDKLVKGIEDRVLEWLKLDCDDSKAGQGSVLSIDLKSKDGNSIRSLVFSRAEINIKWALNAWSVWRIASCYEYPRLISYKVKEISLNDYKDGFVLDNEIRGDNYSSKGSKGGKG